MKLALFCFAVSAFGAVDGTVNNATSGKPQGNVPVTLIALGSGMQTVATVQSGADGKFHFDATLDSKVPYLVQGLHQGVTYNKMLAPGAPGTGVTVDVFDAASKVSSAKVSQHMILLEPTANDVAVSETVIFDNSGTTTLASPEGTFRFFADVNSPIRVTVQGPQGMPVQRPAEKGSEPNTWVVKAPIKPGETRIDLSYTVPAKSPAVFSSKILHEGGAVRIVVPKGVSLVGESVRNAGTHPQTQATIYEVDAKQYAVTISGTGTLRETAQAQAPPEGPASGEESGPGIEQVRPIIYRRMPWILALGIGMLAVGFALLYKSHERSVSSR